MSSRTSQTLTIRGTFTNQISLAGRKSVTGILNQSIEKGFTSEHPKEWPVQHL